MRYPRAAMMALALLSECRIRNIRFSKLLKYLPSAMWTSDEISVI